MDPLEITAVTAAVAGASALGQLTLKYQSRPDAARGKYRIQLEDFIWWHEWVVTATSGLTVLTIKNAAAANPNGLALTITWIAAFIVGYLILPIYIKGTFYTANRQIKHVGYVIVANCFGFAFLVTAAFVGVKIYG